jgi:predicted unusual protein kinase regulating ubiquinone biosynthesis (AarF/ABC1/UbiB family)
MELLIQQTARRTLEETGAALALSNGKNLFTPGQYVSHLSDAVRSNTFLWAETGLRVSERLNRIAPVGLALSRTLVLGTVGTDLLTGYLALQNRARWFPWLVTPQDWERQHARGAQRLLDVATSLGGALIKAGQFASTRPDLLPAVYIEQLAKLQDRVPPLGWSEIETTIRTELGRPLSEVFSRVEQKPIAAASLSQVHRAWLKDGRAVVLKVQYPQINALVAADFEVLNRAANTVALFAPKIRLHSIVEFLKETIPLELDLQREAQAMSELRQALANRNDVVIPVSFPEYSTKRLLVMEFVEGIKVNDRPALEAAGINPSEVVRLLNEVYAEQVFHHHFFHADPHPGNILVQPGPRLVLLDHGLTVRLAPALVKAMGEMVQALVVGDFEAVARSLKAAGLELPEGVDVPTLLHVIGVIFGGAGQQLLGKVSSQLSETVGYIPTDLLLVGRALGMLNGISLQLDPDQETLKTVAAYVLSGTAQIS